MSKSNSQKIKFKDNTGAQFVETFLTHKEAAEFIVKHRLWDGFWKYGWVSKVLIILAILFGLKFVDIIWDWFDRISAADSGAAFAEMGMLLQNVALGSYDFLFSGGIKYIMLFLLEVVIFHICRRTSEILCNISSDLTLDTFVKAQIRMLKVVFRSYVMEMVFTALIKVAFNIFGFIEFMEPVFIFGVQCYFMGFLVMDNYVEQFHMNIKESVRFARQYIGVCLAIGLVLNIFLFIPFIGAIAAPALSAVAVSLIMYRISDLHLNQPLPLDKIPLRETNNNYLLDN